MQNVRPEPALLRLNVFQDRTKSLWLLNYKQLVSSDPTVGMLRGLIIEIHYIDPLGLPDLSFQNKNKKIYTPTEFDLILEGYNLYHYLNFLSSFQIAF